MDYRGKTVIITGASSGIGRQIAIDFAKKKANVALVARRKNLIEELAIRLRSYGWSAETFVCDVSDKESVKKTVSDIFNKFQKMDVLVNCAGVAYYGSLKDMPLEQAEEMIKTNYLGTVYFIKEVLPHMIKQSSGEIVNVASSTGKAGTPNYGLYSASKHAVVGFSESLYYEMKPLGINVHLICPGDVEGTEIRNNQSFKMERKVFQQKKIKLWQVSNEIFISIEKNKFETIIPFSLYAALKLKATFPWIWRKIISKLYERNYSKLA